MKKKFLFGIGICILLIAIAGTSYFIYKKNFTDNTYSLTKEQLEMYLKNFDINAIEMRDLPKNIKTTTKKYNLFQEIYNSDEIVFLYGYEKGSKLSHISESFHNHLQKEITKNNLNKKYNIITLSNPEKYVRQILLNNGIDTDKIESCVDIDNNLVDLIITTVECYNGVCIIDTRKNKYIFLPKKYPEIIIKAMQQYK